MKFGKRKETNYFEILIKNKNVLTGCNSAG